MKTTFDRMTSENVLTAKNDKKPVASESGPSSRQFPCFIPDYWSVEKKYLKRTVGDDVAEDFII